MRRFFRRGRRRRAPVVWQAAANAYNNNFTVNGTFDGAVHPVASELAGALTATPPSGNDAPLISRFRIDAIRGQIAPLLVAGTPPAGSIAQVTFYAGLLVMQGGAGGFVSATLPSPAAPSDAQQPWLWLHSWNGIVTTVAGASINWQNQGSLMEHVHVKTRRIIHPGQALLLIGDIAWNAGTANNTMTLALHVSVRLLLSRIV